MDKHPLKKNRYIRNSTKKRLTIRPIKHPVRLLAIALGCVAVVVTAVVWGNILYQRSEQYRADKAAGRWTVQADTETDVLPAVRDVPPVKGWPLSPGGSLRAFSSSDYSAATLWLCDGNGSLPYESRVASEAGIATDGYDLSDEIARLHENGLRVVGVFTVRAFASADGEEGNTALTHYRMQTELAILEEYAAAGLDEILLVGLPMSGIATSSLSYVAELRERLTGDTPLIGINLSLEVMASALEGSTLPAECLTVCDYLTLDMTKPHTYEAYVGPLAEAETAAEAAEPAFTSHLSRLLFGYRYPYVRYNLRLLFTDEQKDQLNESAEHGFERYLVVQDLSEPS